jgi:hypothetical protein
MTWFEASSWEERYRETTAVWSGRPNGQLIAEAADLPPGTGLDAGSGEGGDALWLARHGWRVTALDFATTALSRDHGAVPRRPGRSGCWGHRPDQLAASGPADLGAAGGRVRPGVGAGSCTCRRSPGRRCSPGSPPRWRRAAHCSSSTTTPATCAPARTGAHAPEVFFTADELAASLDPASWTVAAAGTRRRPALDHEADHGTTVADAVLVARRRPAE